MVFLKRVLLGLGALFMILLGGAGTQSHSTLMQGGGFLGLIIGLIVLYIFAKMAWRAMGCLPSIFLIAAIVVFILYAIGAFSGGVGNVGSNIKSFLGQGRASTQGTMVSAKVNLLEEEEFDSPIAESFSSPAAENQAQPAQQPPCDPRTCRQQMAQPAQQEEGGFFSKLFGGSSQSGSQAAFNPQNYPAVYSPARVISGDTLVVGGRYFRLFGIDAPENNQTCADANGRPYRCGQQAAAWLKSWLQDNELECRVMQEDAKGNMLGVCSLGAYDIGAALVNAGWAVVYSKHTDIYMPYQVQAQNNARGLWQGEFYMPWDWRKIQARKPKIKIINQQPKRKRTFLNPLG